MATIVTRGNSVSVVYSYVDVFGKKRQKWVKVNPGEDPETKKLEIELELHTDTLLTPNTITVKEFMLKFAQLQASQKWAFNTYSGNILLMENHIFPYLGDMQLQKVRPEHIEDLYRILRQKPVMGPKSYNKEEKDIPLLSTTTIRHIHILLNAAFDKAVKWKYIRENPVMCDPPKKRKVEKSIWTSEETLEALRIMEKQGEPFLHAAVHTAFACTLRNGETVAIKEDCVDFESHRLRIDKTLQRVNRQVYEEMPKDDVYYEFPDKVADSKSVLILKSPKTESSFRQIFMTPQLEEELAAHIQHNSKMKEFYGEDYHDYGLLFCLDNGDPIEPKLMEKRFKKWQQRYAQHLPLIEFHGLRHSSVTYKLIVSEGDVKAVQGDSGHASAGMVTDTYSHIQTSRQQMLTAKFGRDFYEPKFSENVAEDHVEISSDEMLLSEMAEQFKKHPEMLKKLLAAMDDSK